MPGGGANAPEPERPVPTPRIQSVSRATLIKRRKMKDIDQLIDQLNGLKARVEKLKECL
jgi:hypothetical protein